MEKFWNTIHFFAYKLMNKLYMSNITVKLANIYFNTAFVKNIFKRNGRTPEMAMKDLKFAYTDKRVGQSSFWAAGIMFAMPFVFFFGLHNFYFLIFNDRWIPSFEIYIYPLVIYGVISGFINYFLLLHKDKYLKYFKKFEKQSHEWKVKWAWISVGVILFPFLVLIGSFIAMLPK